MNNAIKEVDNLIIEGKISGAIFDMDGTLIDSMPIWDNVAEIYLKSIGINPREGLSEDLRKMTINQGCSFIKEEYLLPFSIEYLRKGINETLFKAYAEDIPLKQDISKLLDAFLNARIPMAVVTSSDTVLVDAVFERLDLNRYFKSILTCSEYKLSKETPELFNIARDIIGSETSSTYVFEDSLFAAKVAKEAGYKVVGVFDESSISKEEDLKDLSDIYWKVI